jgi:hypothetical protein
VAAPPSIRDNTDADADHHNRTHHVGASCGAMQESTP